jgi:hypothetical protein
MGWDGKTESWTDKQMDSWKDRKMGRWTDGQTDRRTKGQTDIQSDKQSRQKDKCFLNCSVVNDKFSRLKLKICLAYDGKQI